MTTVQKQKLISVVQKMNRGLHFSLFKKFYSHSSSRKHVLEILDELGIKYHIKKLSYKINDYLFCLDMNVYSAIRILEDYDESPLAKIYDYKKLLEQLKLHEFSKEQICNFLGAKKSQYENILTYLSLYYPIYEDEKTNLIACL